MAGGALTAALNKNDSTTVKGEHRKYSRKNDSSSPDEDFFPKQANNCVKQQQQENCVQ
jgi:hypothetical protein